jgi:glycosyltransferase involved in cell wall biosynthesis
MAAPVPPVLLVVASTYPRWKGDPEPGFVHELSKRLTAQFRVIAVVPHSAGAKTREVLDRVEIIRYRYAPVRMESLINNGGIVSNLRENPWKFLLVPCMLIAQAWSIWRICRVQKVALVHAHWIIPQGLLAALFFKGPILVTSHGADVYALEGRLFDSIRRFVVGRAAAVTAVSRAMMDSLTRKGCDPEKIIVRSMGVDLEADFSLDTALMRSSNEILFVGRLVEKKGVTFLLDAMRHVLAAKPDATLTIIGFGPEEARLRAKAEALGLSGKVHFAGAVSHAELPAYFHRAAVCVAPFVEASSGDKEGLGLVVAEAIGCGCPVVVGKVAAVLDVVGPAYDLLVDPRDTTSMADAIVRVLIDPGKWLQRTEELRGEIAGRLGWRSVASDYIELLKSLSAVRMGAQ